MVNQQAEATVGLAHGTVGADLHVRADGTPVYHLIAGNGPRDADREWLRALPSRMLNADFGVVDFVGRVGELAELRTWREHGPRLQARFLHAAGGQGKSRLAARFAEQSIEDGWLVVNAVHGAGSVLPPASSQDLRQLGAVGLLLIVDYADRWPLTDLSQMLSNSLLHRFDGPVSILMLGRGADLWPSICAELDRFSVECSERELHPLPSDNGQRRDMFDTARRCFAGVYGIADPAAVEPSIALDSDEAGLTLALHITALVAVDAHVASVRPPEDLDGLTIYLLDREHRHWALLHEEEITRTPSEVMNRVVYLAALTGRSTRPEGERLAGHLDSVDDVASALDDHRLCYPTIGPGGDVLEPIYPDRLAEDFLALTMPGHCNDYPAQAWAPPITELLLHEPDIVTPQSRARGIIFLIAGASRWPHLRERYLYPAILRDPQLVLDAGSAALAALAAVPDVDMMVLWELEDAFPEGAHLDLNAGMAAVSIVLAEGRLSRYRDPLKRAESHKRCAFRLQHAGRFEEALAHEDEALAECYLVDETSEDRDFLLGVVLSNRANSLSHLGRRAEAIACSEEAISVRRRLAHSGSDSAASDLAESLGNMSVDLGRMNRRHRAVECAEEAVAIGKRIVERDRGYAPRLALTELNLSRALSDVGRWEDAASHALNCNMIYRDLAEAEPAVYQLSYGKALANVGEQLNQLQRHDEALPFIEKSLAIRRELLKAEVINPGEVGAALDAQSRCFAGLGRHTEAIAAAREGLAIDRRLAAMNPVAHLPDVGRALNELANRLAVAGLTSEAVEACREVVAIRRQFAAANPEAFLPDLSGSLHDLAMHLSAAGDDDEAVLTTREVVQIRRSLISAAPEDNSYLRPDLAISLNNLACSLVDIARGENPLGLPRFTRAQRMRESALVTEAVTLLREAIALYRSLLGEYPSLHEHLAESSEFLAKIEHKAG